MVRGAIDRRGGDEANLIVNELVPLNELDSRYTTGLILCLDEAHGDAGTLKKIHEIVRGYPGRSSCTSTCRWARPGRPLEIAAAAGGHHP